jgi:hypothetical protein
MVRRPEGIDPALHAGRNEGAPGRPVQVAREGQPMREAGASEARVMLGQMLQNACWRHSYRSDTVDKMDAEPAQNQGKTGHRWTRGT